MQPKIDTASITSASSSSSYARATVSIYNNLALSKSVEVALRVFTSTGNAETLLNSTTVLMPANQESGDAVIWFNQALVEEDVRFYVGYDTRNINGTSFVSYLGTTDEWSTPVVVADLGVSSSSYVLLSPYVGEAKIQVTVVNNVVKNANNFTVRVLEGNTTIVGQVVVSCVGYGSITVTIPLSLYNTSDSFGMHTLSVLVNPGPTNLTEIAISDNSFAVNFTVLPPMQLATTYRGVSLSTDTLFVALNNYLTGSAPNVTLFVYEDTDLTLTANYLGQVIYDSVDPNTCTVAGLSGVSLSPTTTYVTIVVPVFFTRIPTPQVLKVPLTMAASNNVKNCTGLYIGAVLFKELEAVDVVLVGQTKQVLVSSTVTPSLIGSNLTCITFYNSSWLCVLLYVQREHAHLPHPYLPSSFPLFFSTFSSLPDRGHTCNT